MVKMRVVVSGGGTGGHIYPALAIARALQEKADAKILYMGSKERNGEASLEQRLATFAGFTFTGVSACGLHRKSPLIVRDLQTNYRGMLEAKAVLQKFLPHIVIGTGGYGAAPVLKAATKLNIPILIHEQNAYPGITNRYLAPQAALVCLTFEAAKEYFSPKSKFVLTGLPVRQEIITANRAEAYSYFGLNPDKTTLLVTGGSQGATVINEAMLDSYGKMIKCGAQIIHLTGPEHFSAIQERLEQEGLWGHKSLVIFDYLERMDLAIAIADLVVSRAGASFLAEIMCQGVGAVLVPYPFAAGNHQMLNAQAMADAGAAVIIPNQDLNSQRLLAEVIPLIETKANQKRLAMSAAAKAMAHTDAAEKIADLAIQIAKVGR